MAITMLYAGALAIWFLVLSVKVVRARTGPNAIGLGDGGNMPMLRLMRGHANFAEYVPIILVMMAMLELSGLPRWALHAIGGTLLFARLAHGYALSFTPKNLPGRILGASLTFLLLGVAGGLCIWKGVTGL